VPVEFLTDEQAAKYAAYDGAPSRTELERFFFLDDADRALIEPKRRAHNRLGFAVQMTTVRFLGVFLEVRRTCRWRWSTTSPSSWAWRTRRR
jgi:TnpA family transposase